MVFFYDWGNGDLIVLYFRKACLVCSSYGKNNRMKPPIGHYIVKRFEVRLWLLSEDGTDLIYT